MGTEVVKTSNHPPLTPHVGMTAGTAARAIAAPHVALASQHPSDAGPVRTDAADIKRTATTDANRHENEVRAFAVDKTTRPRAGKAQATAHATPDTAADHPATPDKVANHPATSNSAVNRPALHHVEQKEVRTTRTRLCSVAMPVTN